MHGIIFAELKKFADSALGAAAWPAIAAEAGVGQVSYLATETYPDEQLSALLGAAVRRSGIPAPQLLEQFGAFIVPDGVGSSGEHGAGDSQSGTAGRFQSDAAAAAHQPANPVPGDDRVFLAATSLRRGEGNHARSCGTLP